MASDTTYDHLIDPEEWAKIEEQRRIWREKAIKAGNRAHVAVERAERKSIDWEGVAEVIQARYETDPGEWVRICKAAKTDVAARNINGGRIDALSGVDAEAIARQSEPGETTFEVFARVAIR